MLVGAGHEHKLVKTRHDGQVAITALSFDADQTLWDFADVQRKALGATIEAMVARGDIAAGAATPHALRAVRSEVIAEHQGRPHNLERVREESFFRFLERSGHASPRESAVELTDIYMTVRFDAIELYPEARAVLARVKPHYKLGLLTNGNTYPDRCGLPNTFDAEVLLQDYDFRKPDPRAFEVIAELLGESTDSIMHIGDDWDDIQGANAVGAVSVFINRTGADPEFRQEADYEIGDLTELEALLANLRP